jgi:acyl-CoA thioesterase-1
MTAIAFVGWVDSFRLAARRGIVSWRTRWASALAYAALVLLLAACGSPRQAQLPAGSTVLAIGDSITAGYGIDPALAWPAQLELLTGWHVVAAGISGDRTAGGRERLPALLDLHTPALVIIELGGNDMLRRVPEGEIVANLEAMIAAARSHGAKVALIAVPQPNALGARTGLSAANFYRELARREQVPLVEKALPAVLSDAALKQDALHPTAEGHRVLAGRVHDELVAIGFAGAH